MYVLRGVSLRELVLDLDQHDRAALRREEVAGRHQVHHVVEPLLHRGLPDGVGLPERDPGLLAEPRREPALRGRERQSDGGRANQ